MTVGSSPKPGKQPPLETEQQLKAELPLPPPQQLIVLEICFSLNAAVNLVHWDKLSTSLQLETLLFPPKVNAHNHFLCSRCLGSDHFHFLSELKLMNLEYLEFLKRKLLQQAGLVAKHESCVNQRSGFLCSFHSRQCKPA